MSLLAGSILIVFASINPFFNYETPNDRKVRVILEQCAYEAYLVGGFAINRDKGVSKRVMENDLMAYVKKTCNKGYCLPIEARIHHLGLIAKAYSNPGLTPNMLFSAHYKQCVHELARHHVKAR